MAKIEFDIKYRPEFESGKYKPILECGVEAHAPIRKWIVSTAQEGVIMVALMSQHQLKEGNK